MKRSNSHIYAGIGFVLAAIIVAAAIYAGIRMGASASASATSSNAATADVTNVEDDSDNVGEYGTGVGEAKAPSDDQEANAALAPSDLVGSFAERTIGDERTCEGVMWVFHDNGIFQWLNERHDAVQQGNWQLRGSNLHTDNITMGIAGDDAVNLSDVTMPVSKAGDEITIGEATYRSCTAP